GFPPFFCGWLPLPGDAVPRPRQRAHEQPPHSLAALASRPPSGGLPLPPPAPPARRPPPPARGGGEGGGAPRPRGGENAWLVWRPRPFISPSGERMNTPSKNSPFQRTWIVWQPYAGVSTRSDSDAYTKNMRSYGCSTTRAIARGWDVVLALVQTTQAGA